ncbi:NAD(P)/FAD-dependent oxidoreductase [Agriterribacter sp.]|uniref:NAD(P)/FAD-dependent oxidoreductase n=1 Tax=Agriterribacter sp. TaxID=2821509 RepID=UPI002BD23BEC|nr:NAD(P)/FAD-dependent oxidoreductase [Agriterribacter sp.]HRO47057.1 NAD(P)/FAD-dependent oxidoreductase [Agriterribacter sp.]HRQ19023.1 NAD(P)/FAD-dependent oxidoreductase [Agriterribacter sp.]
MKQKHLVVIGGGAAGFFTAVNAARMNRALKVTLLEKSGKLLSKVSVSGGGRCNVTHHCFEIAEMIKNYPRGARFVKKAFHHFFTTDTIKWFEERGVALKAEKDGRMFPVTNRSETIIECLMKEASHYGVDIRMNVAVKEISMPDDEQRMPDAGQKRFRIYFSDTGFLEADFVCLACGGYPKASQYNWLQFTGHHIEPPVPSLFTFNMPGNSITGLMGVSVEKAIVKVAETKLIAEGPLLITHWGMSGPCILRLSAWGAKELAAKQYHFTLLVNWVPGYSEQQLRGEWVVWRQQYGANKIYLRNPFALPARLWHYLLQQSNVAETQRWSELLTKQQNTLIQLLTAAPFEVKGKTTFKEEFVTCGGIDVSAIEVNTMQSKKHPGLFFAGEMMNVDGITGGFNFQHAWTSGWIAAKAVAQMAGI